MQFSHNDLGHKEGGEIGGITLVSGANVRMPNGPKPMKIITTTMLTGLLSLSAFAGPPKLTDRGLEPGSDFNRLNGHPNWVLKLTDSELAALQNQAETLLKAVFAIRQSKDLKPFELPQDATGWYNEKRELCQIMWGAAVSKDEFEASFKKEDWKVIPAPEFYLSSMHLPATEVTCYDGLLDKHPAHILWLKSFGQFAFAVDLTDLCIEKESF